MLYLKECKKGMISIVFLLYLCGVFAMYFTQFEGDLGGPLEPPKPGLENYGTIQKEVPEILMPAAVASLYSEYINGVYQAYPTGFYKAVKLTEHETQTMKQILMELTSCTESDLLANAAAVFQSDTLNYERFKELMKQADKLIGGGSKYGDYLMDFSQVPMTYEDALMEYNNMFYKDKISGAYARLYCDYLGIVISILPVFIGVSVCIKDRYSKMENLVHSRRISSFKLIFNRFLAALSLSMIPVVITSFLAVLKIKGLYPQEEVSLLLFFEYSFIWLLPTVLICTSLSMFITELTGGPAAVLIQLLWFFVTVMGSAGKLTGSIGLLTLSPRHNNLLERDAFMNCFTLFLENRILYTAAAVILIILTVFIYELKRRNKLHGFSAAIHLKNKLKAQF